jgi:quinol monooxygenase YgiN
MTETRDHLKNGVNPKNQTSRKIKFKNMKTVIVTHEVKNYSDWRKVYDADEGNRKKAGFHATGVYQSVNNPNAITILGEAPSVEAITKFMSNPDLKAAMEKGGVIGMPDVKILNKI